MALPQDLRISPRKPPPIPCPISEIADSSSNCTALYAANMTKARLTGGPQGRERLARMMRLAVVRDKLHLRP
jgi:hypothetical protein